MKFASLTIEFIEEMMGKMETQKKKLRKIKLWEAMIEL